VDTSVRTSLAVEHSKSIGALVAEAGRLELESVCFDLPDMLEEGRGSRFWLRIPVEVASQPDPEAAPALSNFDGLRALVVADNATNRNVLLHHLRSRGAGLSEAENLHGCLEHRRAAGAEEHPIQLPILDMTLPGMTGLELAKTIRAEASIPQPRTVLLTSMGLSPDPEEERRLDIAVRLTKPARRQRLHRAL